MFIIFEGGGWSRGQYQCGDIKSSKSNISSEDYFCSYSEAEVKLHGKVSTRN